MTKLAHTVRIEEKNLIKFKEICNNYEVSTGTLMGLLVLLALDKANTSDNLIFTLKEEIRNKELLQDGY